MTALPRNTILVGDALEQLRKLPSDSVDCVITSPPFYGLRDYGVDGQIGLERSVEDWVARLLVVCRELARVLKETGSLWIDLGDTYSRNARWGAPPKGLLLAPERLLLALATDGWIVRNKVVWAKTNPMPFSVSDRLNATHDVVYFLVRAHRYYFDLDSIREPHRSTKPSPARPAPTSRPAWTMPHFNSNSGLFRGGVSHPLGKNPGDVWRLRNAGFPGHHATFPPALVQRPLLATCPEKLCSACGTPWRRAVTKEILGRREPTFKRRYVYGFKHRWEVVRRLGALAVACSCNAPSVPGVVLDPFFGTGTVGVVATQLNRDWLGIELNPEYVAVAQKRIAALETAAPDNSSASCGSKPSVISSRDRQPHQHRGGTNVQHGPGRKSRSQDLGDPARPRPARPTERYRSATGHKSRRGDPQRHRRPRRVEGLGSRARREGRGSPPSNRSRCFDSTWRARFAVRPCREQRRHAPAQGEARRPQGIRRCVGRELTHEALPVAPRGRLEFARRNASTTIQSSPQHTPNGARSVVHSTALQTLQRIDDCEKMGVEGQR